MMGRECHAIQASRTARRTVWALDAACVNCERSLAAQAASSGDKRCSSRRGRSSMNCAMDCSDSWGGHDTCSGNGGCGEDDICCECKGISKAALWRPFCLLFKVVAVRVQLWRRCAAALLRATYQQFTQLHTTRPQSTKRHTVSFERGSEPPGVWAIRNMVSVLNDDCVDCSQLPAACTRQTLFFHCSVFTAIYVTLLPSRFRLLFYYYYR
jgi:hypothetical protein